MTAFDINPLPRGCGLRKAGGVYAECTLGEGGVPVDACIVDPPLLVDEVALQLPKRGSVLREWGGHWHLLDRVGEQFYPNVADKVEEIRLRGESRRLNVHSIDFAKITPATRLVLLHRRAHITNAADYYQTGDGWQQPGWQCPKHLPQHNKLAHAPDEMCAGLWWRDLVEGITPLHNAEAPGLPVPVRRDLPAQAYAGWARPTGVTPIYACAVFMILPLSRIAVVRGEHDEHIAPLATAQRAQVPVALVAM